MARKQESSDQLSFNDFSSKDEEAGFDEIILEMFRVSAVNSESVGLICEFEDLYLYPVAVPPEIRQHIRVGQVHLMRIGRMGDDLKLIYLSAPYFGG